jgi:hypothetical protein
MSPAFAEGRGKGGKRGDSDQHSEEIKKKNAQIEQAYKDALKKIPDQKPSDPWANIRH